jgi:hypothetical protein
MLIEGMTKPGFTSITVSEELKQQLTMTARVYGFRSVPALINSLLQQASTNMVLLPNGRNITHTFFTENLESKPFSIISEIIGAGG